jgi:hypothetical protein
MSAFVRRRGDRIATVFAGLHILPSDTLSRRRCRKSDAFQGGIDDQPTARLQDLKGARNFVDQALSEISQGNPVSVTTSRAYGCSIKYGS